MKDYNFNHYQCWYPVFERIFNIKKINKMLEFGLGNGTEFLCDNVDFLYSVELAVHGDHNKWHDTIKSKMNSYTNWQSDLIMCPKSIIDADTIVLKNKNYYLEDKIYSVDLKNIVEPYIKKEWDLIFVDPGIHLRGEMIGWCIEENIPIIVNHDTEFQSLYGYDLINLKQYKYYSFDTTHGTGVFVNVNDPSNKELLAKL
jgi:hypothetical protein